MEQLAFLQKRQKLRRQEAARSETHEPIDLFGGTPFGILAPPAQEGETVERNDQVNRLVVQVLWYFIVKNFRSQ